MDENLENELTPEENAIKEEIVTSPETMEENELNVQKKQKLKFFINGGLYSFLLTFGIVFLVSLYIFQIFMSPIKVVGKSMQPTINASVLSDSDEDHCDIVYYHKQDSYTNENIVIVSNENDKYVKSADASKPVNYLIKRVIACPGDTITFYVTNIENETYYYDISVKNKNNKTIPLSDEYIDEEMSFSYGEYVLNKFYYETYSKIFSELAKSTSNDYKSYSLTIKDNEYFVMGDNRNNSEDSRYFGTVSVDSISGKVLLQVPYGQNIWQALFQKLKEQIN